MKIIDAIGIAIVAAGIALTVLNYFATHRLAAHVEPIAIQEYTPRGQEDGPNKSKSTTMNTTTFVTLAAPTL